MEKRERADEKRGDEGKVKIAEVDDVRKIHDEEEEGTTRPIPNEANCVLTMGHQTLNQYLPQRSHTHTHARTHSLTVCSCCLRP